MLISAAGCFGQCTIQTISGNSSISSGPAKLNANFASLNTCKPQRFTGTTAPGVIAASRRGDLYTDTTSNLSYQCFAVAPCTTVAAGNWVCLNCGGGAGTVTVVGAGNLISTALVTGGGSQTAQTPNAQATMDASGNIATQGTITTGTGGSSPGTVFLNPTTVSGLPTCNAGAKGTHAFVTDATATTFLSVVAGSGSNNVPVVCNGTNWLIG